MDGLNSVRLQDQLIVMSERSRAGGIGVLTSLTTVAKDRPPGWRTCPPLTA